jgi:uncharacterized protein (DUF885 family)
MSDSFNDQVNGLRVSTAPPAERLKALSEAHWDHLMTEYPEWATFVGYPKQNHRWTDWSADAIEGRKKFSKLKRETISSIPRGQLQLLDQVTYDVLLCALELEVDKSRFPEELLPMDQLDGAHLNIARTLAASPVRNMKDLEDCLARLQGVSKNIEQVLALLKRGVASGVTHSSHSVRGMPSQIQGLLQENLAQSALLTAFQTSPESVSKEAHARLKREAEKICSELAYPALRRLHDYVKDSYLPSCRKDFGWKGLPNGPEWYEAKVREYTTTKLTPREIHQIGMDEVSRIRTDMDRVMADAGFQGRTSEFLHHIHHHPEFFHSSPDAMLASYRDLSKQIDPLLVNLFQHLPRLPYGVRAVPAYAEKSTPPAYYEPGTIQGARAGYFYANTYNLPSRPKWEMEALTLHEAVPGHHLQIALSQELEGLPEFRKNGMFIAYIEGWGLYSESLGKELGLYKDPYSEFGRLSFEVWRAARLVVDTGMHALGWSRDQAIEFFEQTTFQSREKIEVEIDRYLVRAGQALAYKVGELKIQALRKKAVQTLGGRFDIRSFHHAVLSEGALPLDVLERQIDRWTESSLPNL